MSASKRPQPQPEPSLPAVHVLHLAAAVRACGGDGDSLVDESGFASEALVEPAARIALPRFIALVERAIALSGEQGLGLMLGAQAPIARFGTVGFAALASATLREAIEVMVKYMAIITTAFQYQLRVERGRAVLELEECAPLGAAKETVIYSSSIALWRLGESMTGATLPADVEFPFAEPDWFRPVRSLAPGSCAFDADRHRIKFDARLLELPLLSADPAAARTARDQCERELQALTQTSSFVDQVSASLFREDRVLSAAELARTLGMAERTLKRRLAEHQTSYTDLLEERRKHAACELLRAGASIEDIAERLGYSDASNFTRAFRRWTGQSPRAFRRTASNSE